MSKNTGTSELINYFDLGANGDVGIAGSLDINTIANATTDTDKFLVSDTGIVKYRTGAELLADIGGQAAGNFVTLNTIQTITAQKTFTGSGSSDTMLISHGSGSGIALNISKAGNGEGLRVAKSSGSGNAVTITGGVLQAEAGIFSGDVQSSTRLAATNGSQQMILTPNLGGSVNRFEALGGLPLALITTGASLTLAAGGVIPQFTLTPSLATFTNTVVSGGFFAAPNGFGLTASNAAGTAGRILIKLNTSNQIEIGRDTDISAIILGTASSVNALTIASTGAATFTSSVNSVGLISSSTVRPSSNFSADLGTSSFRWADIFGFSLNVTSLISSQVNTILADGAGVVLQGYVDNNLRIAVRGSGYNSGARGGLIASNGDFSGSLTVLSNNGIVVGAGGRAFMRQTIGGDAEIGAPLNGVLFLISNGVNALSFNGVGTASFETSSSISATFNSTNTNGGYLGFRRGGTSIGYLGNSAQLGQGILNALELRADNNLFLTTTSGLLAMTIGGNVGINTNNPGGFLEISSPNSNNVQMLLVRNFAVSATGNFTGNYTAEVRGASAGNVRHAMLIHLNENASDRRILDVTSLVGTVASFSSNGVVSIPGSLSKGSGSFKIDHPLPEKKDTHHLVHSFIEGPQADNIYRGKVQLVDGHAEVNIDEASGMTEGTFVVLNGNVQCFTSNESGWTAIKGRIDSNILTIESEDFNCTDTVSWMVVGERHDQHMIDTDWTDKNGKVIVEPLKKINK